MDNVTKADLLAENAIIRSRLAELERAAADSHPARRSSDADPERMRMSDAHDASERRYRRLFESAREGIIVVDATTGMITDVNPSLCNLLGYSRDEAIKKAVWELSPFKDTAASKSRFRQVQNADHVHYAIFSVQAKDGSIKQVEVDSNVYLVAGERVIQCNVRESRIRLTAEERTPRVPR